MEKDTRTSMKTLSIQSFPSLCRSQNIYSSPCLFREMPEVSRYKDIPCNTSDPQKLP